MSWIVVATLGVLMISAWAGSIYTDRFTSELPGDGLLSTRGLYAAANRRFWLDDFYHKVIVDRSVKMGQRLENFDGEVSDRITGTPTHRASPAYSGVSWEESYLAARTQVTDDILSNETDVKAGLMAQLRALGAEPEKIQTIKGESVFKSSGLFGVLTGAAVSIANWIESNIFNRWHGGIARTGGSFGNALYRFEDWLGQPRFVIVILILLAAAYRSG